LSEDAEAVLLDPPSALGGEVELEVELGVEEIGGEDWIADAQLVTNLFSTPGRSF
jgi:hypothetical protein